MPGVHVRRWRSGWWCSKWSGSWARICSCSRLRDPRGKHIFQPITTSGNRILNSYLLSAGTISFKPAPHSPSLCISIYRQQGYSCSHQKKQPICPLHHPSPSPPARCSVFSKKKLRTTRSWLIRRSKSKLCKRRSRLVELTMMATTSSC